MLPKYSNTAHLSSKPCRERMDVLLTCCPANMTFFYLLRHDELPRRRLNIDVFRLLSVNLRILVGLMEFFGLVLDVLQQLGVVCERILQSALAQDATVGTDVDYEVCDRADHCNVVGLHDTVLRCCVHRDVSLAYHQNDGASTQEVTVETFVDDPAGSVDVESSKNLLVCTSVLSAGQV